MASTQLKGSDGGQAGSVPTVVDEQQAKHEGTMLDGTERAVCKTAGEISKHGFAAP